MKQTAVEWLESNLPTAFKDLTINKQLIEQAKEMEKQQIIDAHGNKIKKSGSISNATYILTGKEYYETTFNKDE
jgi:hypothetical protein